MNTVNISEGKRGQRTPVLFKTAIVLTALFTALTTQANPRSPLPPLPELSPTIYHERFDDAYFYGGFRTAQVITNNYTLDESWSGYALRRTGAVTPFIVPGVGSTGHANMNCTNGAIHFWFEPVSWSSASLIGGTAPGKIAILLELDVLGNNQSANVWTLEVSADGTTLLLIGQADANPTLLLQTRINWQASQTHLIVLNFSSTATALFIDGQLAAEGFGTQAVPPALAALSVGSSLTGASAAGGDFDELYSYKRGLRPAEVSFYYNGNLYYATMGPISAAELAVQEQRRATNLATRQLADASLSAKGSGVTLDGLTGGGECPTNVPLCLTNVLAALDTNGLMTVSFDVVGGTNGFLYDVFVTPDLASQQWFWVTNSPSCNTVVLSNQPATQSFYMLRDAQQDSDGDLIPDWLDGNPFDPNVRVLTVIIDAPADGAVVQ